MSGAPGLGSPHPDLQTGAGHRAAPGVYGGLWRFRGPSGWRPTAAARSGPAEISSLWLRFSSLAGRTMLQLDPLRSELLGSHCWFYTRRLTVSPLAGHGRYLGGWRDQGLSAVQTCDSSDLCFAAPVEGPADLHDGTRLPSVHLIGIYCCLHMTRT